MGSIAAWAKAHPERVSELLASNPSYVFFGRNPDSNEGPRGSLNVPLTPGYSVAIDRKVIPLGSLLWLSTTRPDGSSVVRPVLRRTRAVRLRVKSALICSGALAMRPGSWRVT